MQRGEDRGCHLNIREQKQHPREICAGSRSPVVVGGVQFGALGNTVSSHCSCLSSKHKRVTLQIQFPLFPRA